MGDGGGDLNYTMVVYQLLMCSWLILSLIASKGDAEKRSYMTYDMAAICKTHPNFKIRMHHSGTGSTGILKATDYLSEEEEKECVAVIRPPRGYGVIFHLDDVKLRKDANYECRDYMKMYNETSRNNFTSPMCRDCCRHSRVQPVCSGKCGYESDGLICEEFCDKGGDSFIKHGTGESLVVHYHTRCGACASKKQEVGFRMVFTAYRLLSAHEAACVWPSDFQCDNGRCIWSGLTCDGYNNCGDMSDENKAGISHCGGFPDPVKAAIIASAVIVTVLLGVLLAYFPRLSWGFLLGKKRKNASTRLTQRHVKKPSQVALINKAGPSRSVSFQTPLPKIKEHSCSESEM